MTNPTNSERERCATLCEAMAEACAAQNQMRCARALQEAARLIRETGERE